MFVDKIMFRRLMAEAGEEGGSAGAETATADTAETAATVGAPAEAGAGAGDGDGEEPKPFLGDDANGDGEKKPGAGEAEKPAEGKTYDEKTYLDAVKVDPKVVGMDMDVDQDVVKAMVPTLNEIGVTPEQASKLANAMVKAQVEQQRQYMKGRVDYFNRMKEQATKTYGQADWKQINAGIDACFKKGGIMNSVIRNSELGADPEFLALMHKMGAASMVDTGAGAVAGSGAGVGDGNSCAGISKIWK